MSVPVQTPSKEYIANGTTTAFPLEFNCDKAEYLIVTLNGEEAPVGSWTLANDTVTFNVAPVNGVVVNLQRNTPFQRTTNYQLYDNSFRPSAVNKDFDLIWWKLQELGYRDQVIWLALVKEIADRIDGDEDLQNQINTIDEWLANLQQNVNENTNDIAQLVNDLSKEIADRITGDQILKDMFISMIDEAINEGTVNALAVTHIDSVEDLQNVTNVWDGRTITVKNKGDYRYDALTHTWVKSYQDADNVIYNGSTQKQVNDAQKSKNEQWRTIKDFNNDFVAASNWIKQSTNNFVELFPGEVYTLTQTGTLFFNRYVCKNGKATVKVPASLNLDYYSKTDGTEIVYLEGIKYLVAGHRGTLTTDAQQLYPFTYSRNIRSQTLKRLVIKGLTDINDENSWSDDTGSTRMQGFIEVRVSDFSYIEDVEHYGIGLFCMITFTDQKATRYEKNVVGFNNETNIYSTTGLFRSGKSSDIKIINTEAQKTYWIKKNAGVGLNGKNCILCESDATDLYEIDNITGLRAIEKSVYNTCKNSITRNINDIGCFSACTIKHKKTPGLKTGNVDGIGVTSKNPSNTVGVMDVYGWNEANFKDYEILLDARIATYPFMFDDVGKLTVNRMTIKNAGCPIRFIGEEDCGVVKFLNSSFINCWSQNTNMLFLRSGTTKNIDELHLINVMHSIENLSSFAGSSAEFSDFAAPFDGVKKVYLDNVEAVSRVSPFKAGAITTYLKVINCRFTLYSNSTISNMWLAFINNAYVAKANEFDFSILFMSSTSTSTTYKVNFKKLKNDGIVNCVDYWNQVDIDYKVTGSGTANVAQFGDKSFKLTATYLQSQIEFVYDAVTKTVTQIFNVGGMFATTATANKISLSIDGTGMLIITIGSSWTNPLGNLTIRLSRF